MKELLFKSKFGTVEYISKDNVVLLTWKEKCSFDVYRNTTLAALSGLQKHLGSNFVVDARHGYEDEKEDVAWGFEVLLPAISATTCKTVVFIMENANELEDEMDLWTCEFMKYFYVVKADTYQKAIAALNMY